MRTATTAAALVLALVLAGCSGSSSDTDDDNRVAAAGGASAAATPSAGGQGGGFAGTADIIAALNDSGLPCTDPMTGTFPGVSDAQSCILNDAEDVVLLRFADDAEKQDYLANKDELASAVVGPDWAVQTVLPQTAEQVAEVLGGEVVAGEGGEQPAG